MGDWGIGKYKFIFPDGLQEGVSFEELGDIVEDFCTSISNSFGEGFVEESAIVDEKTSFKLKCWILYISGEDNFSRGYFDQELRKIFPAEVRQKLDEQHSCIYDFCKRYKCYCVFEYMSESTVLHTNRTIISADGSVLFDDYIESFLEDDMEEYKNKDIPKWENIIVEDYAKNQILSTLDGKTFSFKQHS